VSLAAMRSMADGVLERDIRVGDAAVLAGSEYEIEFQWAHAFAGFSHRFAGYTRESRFDLAGHVGVMVDHASARLEAGGTSARTAQDERGWAALAAGVVVGLWEPGTGGLVLELLQSIPINIGGQTLASTDVRLVLQHDLTDSISLVVGYRRIIAAFRTFDDPAKQGDSSTPSALDLGGPILGLDVRF
jgi:hypothetical protein